MHPVAPAAHLPRVLPSLGHLVLRLDHRHRRAEEKRFVSVIIGDRVYHERRIRVDRSNPCRTLVSGSHLPADEHDGLWHQLIRTVVRPSVP
jgi:hypothetical protein